jgi:hypothetical protein
MHRRQEENMTLRIAGAGLAFVALAVTLAAAPVRTGSGLVSGAVADGVQSWKGIAFAAVPLTG